MIVCPACQHRNAEGTTVCDACHGSLTGFVHRACPSCGALSPAQNAFCHYCLERLVPGDEPPAEDALPVTPFVPADELEHADRWGTSRLAGATLRPTAKPSGSATRERIEEELPAAPSPPVGAPASGQQPTLPTVGEPATVEQEPLPRDASATDRAALIDAAVGGQPPVTPAPSAERRQGTPERALPRPRLMLADVTIGPLEALDDLLPIEPVIARPHRLTEEKVPEDETLSRHAALFRQIAAERAPLTEPVRMQVPRQDRLWPRLGRIALHLLVLVAALVPLLTPGWMAWQTAPHEAVESPVQAVAALDGEAVVLLSFDYGPMYAGELDALALATVQGLAARTVRTVAICTRPEGVELARRIYRIVAEEQPGYRYGEDYAILGYLPGREAGLRALSVGLRHAFVTDAVEYRLLSDLPVTRDVLAVQDFDHVIVFAEDEYDVRRWVEQVQSRRSVSLHALVTARVEPMLVPYRQSGQLVSLMSGATVTADGRSTTLVTMPALAWGYAALSLVILAIAIVTNVVYLVQRTPPQEQEEQLR